MYWAALTAELAAAAAGQPPAVTLNDVIIRDVLGYGFVGIVALVLAWLLYKGKFVTKERSDEMVTAARHDLLRENERLIGEKQRAEEQRDEALAIATDKLVPLLTSFVATSQSLIPLLQELVRRGDPR